MFRNPRSSVLKTSFQSFLALALIAVTAKAGDHTVDLTIHSLGGSIGWHFSQYFGATIVVVDYEGIRIRIPTSHSNFQKIVYRDDDSQRMQPGETWHQTFGVRGPGIFILDFSDWDDAAVEVNLSIDNVPRLVARGNSENLSGWSPQFGPRARQTDDREIAIDLD
jgi:hypothetical protein